MNTIAAIAPALAFLLVGVPLAALLDRLGYFVAVVGVIGGRRGRDVSVVILWIFAAITTIIFNLDTTIVLLTPIFVRLAHAAQRDPFEVAMIPLLLASFASSLIPVSNLTNLILVEQLDLEPVDMIGNLWVPTLIAVTSGFLLYSMRYAGRIRINAQPSVNQAALRIGGAATIALLLGFVIGPQVGIEPWMTALAVDIALAIHLKWIPWRQIPAFTAVCVGAISVLIAVVSPQNVVREILKVDGRVGLGLVTIGVGLFANLVNNLPATVVAADAIATTGQGVWAWLVGVNIGAAMLPMGALANLLWIRILRTEGVDVTWRRYAREITPLAATTFLVVASGATLLR